MNKSLLLSIFLFALSTVSDIRALNESSKKAVSPVEQALLETQATYFTLAHDAVLKMKNEIQKIPAQDAANIFSGLQSNITNERINAAILLAHHGCSLDTLKQKAFEEAISLNSTAAFLVAVCYHSGSDTKPDETFKRIFNDAAEKLNQEQIVAPLIAMIKKHLENQVANLAQHLAKEN